MDEYPQLMSAESVVRDLMSLRVNLCGKWWYEVVGVGLFVGVR